MITSTSHSTWARKSTDVNGISNEAIHLVATYTTLSGQQRIATSPTLNQLVWRIFTVGEARTITGDYPEGYEGKVGSNIVGENPAPFTETYSKGA